MTITRTSAKQYFETNDKPTQAQFAEVFEGIVFQAGASAQAVASNVSAAGRWDFLKDISVSGNVSAATLNVAGVATITGAASFSSTINVTGITTLAGGQAGITNGTAAQAGNVGQTVTSTVLVGAAVPCSNNQAQNITSISIPAGDWMVWGNIWTSPAGGTTTTILEGSISSTSSANPTAPATGAYNRWAGSVVGTQTNISMITNVNVSATTIHYLVGTPTFSGSTLSAYGSLNAKRVR